MPDFVITLGGIAFQDFEIPESIRGLGGRQLSTVHKLIGGARVVDNMGRDDSDLTWTGRFRGVDSVSRARAIDAMRISGASQSLTFGDFSFTVSVDEFTYDIERFYEVPYSLRLIVLTDNSSTAAAQAPGVDEMLSSDNTWAQSLGATVGDSGLSGLLSALNSTVGTVQDFAAAGLEVLNGVLTPILAAQDYVEGLIASAEGTMLYGSAFGSAAPVLLTEIGGVVPLASSGANTSSLLAQVAAATQVANLYTLHNVLGRMATNIAAIGQSGAWVTQSGGDLYRLAERAYGDATEWATIARANGLTDPVLSGLNTILVPPLSGDTQGVLTDLRPAPSAAGAVAPFLDTDSSVPGVLDFSDPANSIAVTVI
jgi:hypothetical protein